MEVLKVDKWDKGGESEESCPIAGQRESVDYTSAFPVHPPFFFRRWGREKMRVGEWMRSVVPFGNLVVVIVHLHLDESLPVAEGRGGEEYQ